MTTDGGVDVRAIGVVVAARRGSLGMSQYELSRDSGVSHSQIRRLESGVSTTLGVDTFVKLANALGLSPERLLRYAGVRTAGDRVEELGGIVDRLTEAEREALLRIAEVLVQLRD